ncbi:MAG: ABC transporter ATP-binding protein [Candidatus Heimdallarchaeota archaeon]|nr:ABC transporter ATP-binding protein [Candidatus Heimdallarchaeota archaeon]MCK5048136.1 ABC transporter ATP-binding protein [Candidatus Heimdallarchaeota archaeon]
MSHHDADKEQKKGSFGYTDMQLYKFMFKYALPYKRELLILLVYMVFFSITTSIGPLLIKLAIDRVTDASDTLFSNSFLDNLSDKSINAISSIFSSANKVWLELTIIALLYFSFQLITFIFSYKRTLLMAEVGLDATNDLRIEVFSHIQELDLSYHDKNEVGRIMSRVTSDVEAIRNFLGGQVVDNIANLMTVVVVLIFIFMIDPILALVPLLLIPPILVVGTVGRRYSRERRKETRRINAMMMANIAESIAGIKVTKGLNREARNIDIFQELNEESAKAEIYAQDITAFLFPILLFSSALGSVSLILFGGLRVIDGAISIGDLLAFLGYNAILFRPVQRLGNFYQQLQAALTGAERVKSLLETPTKVPWNEDNPSLPPIEGEVQFEKIFFEYEEGVPIYEDFNLLVPSGKTIAFVGLTGAGKTTIINILSRMYEFQEGNLRIDGHNLLDYSLPSFKNQIAAVPQDFFLFSKSVRENLKMGNPEATEEQMWFVLEQVGMKRFVERMENGIDTHIQERGSRLSVGQRQLVVFAAVLLADPKILILDEATSSIDVFSEIKIQKAIKLLLKGRTSFIIAHRLSTIRNADNIAVIDAGKIVETGTHEELFDKKGAYYNLVKSQIKLAEV